ncbi:MAG TPA: RNA methyltransferase [Candidatus Polarisedimenticolia bacterium]|nr:RNA methyltransferase [Candidatus Polarisedimenticolia bacterium]
MSSIRGGSPTERIIDSPHNATLRRIRALERDPGERRRSGLYIAWGLHLAQEALDQGAPLREALVGPRLEDSDAGRLALRRLQRLHVTIHRTTTRLLESTVEGSGDQGILLVVPRPDLLLAQLLEAAPSLLLAAHGIQDPGNLGSIIRTARAFGAGAVVVLEGCTDPFGSRAVRAAMGAQFGFAVTVAGTRAGLEAFATGRMQIVAADPGGPVPPTEVDLRRPTVLLVGAEGAGLPRALLEAAAVRVGIPMAPGPASLNVHAAAAVLLYEAARQRRFGAPGGAPR